VEAAEGGAETGVEEAANAESRAAVEARAMDAVMAQERRMGFEPRDVSAENRGYDIESREPATGRLRFIEVKGRRADARDITITRNEMLAALNAGPSCILAVVLVERGFAQPASANRRIQPQPTSSSQGLAESLAEFG